MSRLVPEKLPDTTHSTSSTVPAIAPNICTISILREEHLDRSLKSVQITLQKALESGEQNP